MQWGPWGPWAHGPMGPWAPGPMGPWAHGLMDPWAHGFMGSWAHGTMGPWSMAPWAQGPMGPWAHGHKDAWLDRWRWFPQMHQIECAGLDGAAIRHNVNLLETIICSTHYIMTVFKQKTNARIISTKKRFEPNHCGMTILIGTMTVLE